MMVVVVASGGKATTRKAAREGGPATKGGRMSHIKHATIGALVTSLCGAGMGFLLWAKQLDYRGPNRGTMRVVGWMGLGIVTVGVALACLAIAFLQYLSLRQREDAAAAPRPEDRKRALARREA
jgi:hypothetical protein